MALFGPNVVPNLIYLNQQTLGLNLKIPRSNMSNPTEEELNWDDDLEVQSTSFFHFFKANIE